MVNKFFTFKINGELTMVRSRLSKFIRNKQTFYKCLLISPSLILKAWERLHFIEISILRRILQSGSVNDISPGGWGISFTFLACPIPPRNLQSYFRNFKLKP